MYLPVVQKYGTIPVCDIPLNLIYHQNYLVYMRPIQKKKKKVIYLYTNLKFASMFSYFQNTGILQLFL